MSKATATKSKGILFKGEMVRALLEGRKTQTRRLVKPQPTSPMKPWPKEDSCVCIMDVEAAPAYYAECGLLPHKPGDVLYVKETFGVHRDFDTCERFGKGLICYRADGTGCPETLIRKWKPSIFMPRSAARIWLEVTAVRCERLQDISEEDAEAEGASGPQPACIGGDICEVGPPTFRDGYRELWNSINTEPGTRWEDNPWVFAYTFKRTEAP